MLNKEDMKKYTNLCNFLSNCKYFERLDHYLNQVNVHPCYIQNEYFNMFLLNDNKFDLKTTFPYTLAVKNTNNTAYGFMWMSTLKDNIGYDHRTLSFERVLKNSSPEIQKFLIFNLEIFTK